MALSGELAERNNYGLERRQQVEVNTSRCWIKAGKCLSSCLYVSQKVTLMLDEGSYGET